MTRLAACLLLSLLPSTLLGQTAAGGPAEELRKKTAARFEEIAQRTDGVMAYSIVDLTSGARFDRLSDAVLPTASTIKLAILYDLVARADEGKLRLDDALPLDRRRAVPGGLLYELGTPTLSLRDYATAMVVLSDNTATNVLIDLLGMEAVTARVHALGLKDTRLRRHMIDLDAARRGNENVSTPSEIGRLLEVIYKGQGLSPRAREQALGILKKEKIPPSALNRALPAGVDVANKPGDLEGVRVDAGIVFAKNRPYVFSAMTSYLRDDDAGERAIEELARVAYGYFSRLGAGSEYGRQIGR